MAKNMNDNETFLTISRQSTRRMFLTTLLGATGAAALWKVGAFQTAIVNAAGRAGSSGMVTIVQFSDLGKATGKSSVPVVVKPDSEWKQKLSQIQYEVSRHAGTERPYTGNTWNNHDHGLYRCVCCDNALFSSDTKFESGTGWPSFWQPLAKENVAEIVDGTLGMTRTEVRCRECDGHLGHVFDDGPRPTGLRYCMNSAAMKFVKSA